ncbi:SLAM family member 5-like isoform X2 [Carassius auratus]|uniref:SLAM family member 5-like isoform X2 n=1 Tax=Carassius auratus TaxID=7957 RepID=A0A6P6J524_CARAU|nr:SLAM family member 5-like isoform X2 [Carassius auratus]
MEGESVTLQTNVTELQTRDLITWTFGYPETSIAQINKEEGNVSTYDGVLDGRFRDRLKLDNQTGSLIITDTRTTDSGNYTVIIKGTKSTTYRFNLTVYVSASQKILISAAAAGFLLIVAAVGIYWIYRRHRKTDQEETDQTGNEEITYAEATFFKQKAQKLGAKKEDEVVYADVVTRNGSNP